MTSKNISLTKPTRRFRPQNLSKRAVMIERLKFKKTFNYNYQERHSWYPAGWGFNRRVLGKIFGQLHYRAYHSPTPVSKRWMKSYKAFERKHLPLNGSMRFLNTWTAHSWL